MSILTPRIDKLENNHLINGAFDFWQRGTSFTLGPAVNSDIYYADRWKATVQSVTNTTLTMTRSTDVPTASTTNPTYSSLATVTVAGTQNTSSYILPFWQRIEGTFFKNLHKNTMTVQFWIKASIAGTYPIALRNGANTRSFATTFAVASPNTWTFVSKVIQLDLAGTWTTDNTIGIEIFIASSVGSGFTVSSNDTWQNGNFFNAVGTTNWFITGATVQIAEVAIYKGDLGNSSSSGAASTAFKLAGRTYQGELILCERYWRKYQHLPVVGTSTTTISSYVTLNPEMVKAPTAGQTGVLNIQNATVNSAQTGLSMNTTFSGQSMVILTAGLFSGGLLATQTWYWLGIPANNGNYVFFDAEL